MTALRIRASLLVAIAVATTSCSSSAQPAARTIEAAQVRMRDGVTLKTDVHLPATTGRVPVVLIRTPYKTEISPKSEFINRLIAAGYAVVQQHERGRFLSEGEMHMLGRADEDGWDTLDWIAAQEWSNGKVATYGCSSSAENQLKLASLGHPAHKAMIAYSAGVGVAEADPFASRATSGVAGCGSRDGRTTSSRRWASRGAAKYTSMPRCTTKRACICR